jgi:hypothetical protein
MRSTVSETKPDPAPRWHYYGQPLEVKVADGRLTIAIGIDVLAHAVSYADWANPFDEQANDYIRTFAIENAEEFAKDVKRMMLDEREDGSSLLTDFLDEASEAAVGDGSLGLSAEDHTIKHGETAPCETWSKESHD